MAEQVDRLEENLKQQVGVLESIYDSDRRFADRFSAETGGLGQYDEYIEEQNAYIERLVELDRQYDEIYANLKVSHETVRSEAQRQNIMSLVNEIEGKIQAVNSIEEKTRSISEEFFKKHKTDIAKSRKTARVIQNHYRPNPGHMQMDTSIFDSSQ